MLVFSKRMVDAGSLTQTLFESENEMTTDLGSDNALNDQPEGYRTQKAWREIQSFLPKKYQLAPADEPTEDWWDWHGHRIHLDRFKNAAAKVKVILFHGVGTNGRQMSTILGRPLFESASKPSPSTCPAMA